MTDLIKWLIILVVLFLSTVVYAGDEQDWPVYGGSITADRYSDLEQINRENVHKLKRAWMFDSGDEFPGSEMQCNPLVIDGVLFATTPSLNVIALDAATGKLLWKFEPLPRGHIFGKPRGRGLSFWADGNNRRLFTSVRHYLYALDPLTGKPIESFGSKGRIDLREGLGRDPATQSVSLSTPGIVYQDLLILGSVVSEMLPSSPGDVRAYDVHSGDLRWSFHTIPHPGEFGFETWPPDAWQRIGGANNWAGMSIDGKRGIVYVPTGSAAFDYYGGNRKGNNLFANSLIALDAATGKRLWHFQIVRHDILDRDLPAQPILATVKQEGRNVDAVIQLTKTGHIFVFDRLTGKSLYPIRYQQTSKSPVPGEFPALTQPLPSKPEPLVRQYFVPDEVTTRTPEATNFVLKRLQTLRTGGPFEPTSLEGTVIFPGLDGGAEWGGGAFDRHTHVLYVNMNEMPYIVRLKENNKNDNAIQNGEDIYRSECAGCHGMDLSGSPPRVPSLKGLSEWHGPTDLIMLLMAGSGRMPSFSHLGISGLSAVAEYVLYGKSSAVEIDSITKPSIGFSLGSLEKFLDMDGYPAVKPPWGTLNAIDLDSGSLLWKVPLGEYPELADQGVKTTGSENYGGPLVTAGGLVLIGATSYDKKFRAFDKSTGQLLWESTLPASAHATPATYMVDGRQYIVVAAGGGKSNAESRGVYVAFSLPKTNLPKD